MEAVAAWKVGQAVKHWSEEGRTRVGRAWLSLGLPDWGAADWEQLRKTRESAAGHDFRRVAAIVAESGDEGAVDDAVKWGE